jgi:hypothetical protein
LTAGLDPQHHASLEDAVTLRSLDCYSLDTERASFIAMGFVDDQLVDVFLDMPMMLLFEMIGVMAWHAGV